MGFLFACRYIAIMICMNRIAQHCAYNTLSLFAIIKTKRHDIGVVGTIIIGEERV